MVRAAAGRRAPRPAGRRALSTAPPPPPLVAPAKDQRPKFVRCVQCGKALTEPLLCSASLCVSYCSETCQRVHWASGFAKECDNFKRYATTDVRVSLPDDPEWLRTAMDHDGNMSYGELLEQIGAHEGAYKLLSGSQSAPSPHRHLINALDGDDPVDDAPSSWAEYYRARGTTASPLATLLSFPLTLRHILTHVDPPPSADGSLRVHYLGPEKELLILPLFRELALLMPSTALHVDMIGPVAFDLPSKPLVYDGPRGGRVTITAHRGAYHTLAREGQLQRADVTVALNAGLAASGYGWGPTLELLSKQNRPFFFTDYSEYSAEKAASVAEAKGLKLTVPVAVNPFRAPLRQPLVAGGSLGFPWLSNGFLAGFNTT